MRYILLFVSLVLWLAIGRFVLALDSVIDLVHFTSVPLVISYLLIFRPKTDKKNVISYSICFAVFTSLVMVYFITFSQTIPNIRINWTELPIAVYFLLSVYIILLLLDKFINLVIAIIFASFLKNRLAFGITKSVIRLAILIFVIAPYLVAVFSTHWVKFSDTADPKKLLDMEYKQVSFNAKDGVRLNGWFISAENRVSDSTVIIVPGRSPAKNLFLSYAKIFIGTGYNVFLFDTRGNGNSSGHKYSFTINEVNDVIGALDYLKANSPESSRYIFGFGAGEGASALIAAAAVDERFAAVTCDSARGYEVKMPVILARFMPRWMSKSILCTVKAVLRVDIGCPIPGDDAFNQKVSQVSPCPILVASSLRNNEPYRMRAIELYTNARQPKKLWLAPAKEDECSGDRYFLNILETFDMGKTKQNAGRWRISAITQ